MLFLFWSLHHLPTIRIHFVTHGCGAYSLRQWAARTPRTQVCHDDVWTLCVCIIILFGMHRRYMLFLMSVMSKLYVVCCFHAHCLHTPHTCAMTLCQWHYVRIWLCCLHNLFEYAQIKQWRMRVYSPKKFKYLFVVRAFWACCVPAAQRKHNDEWRRWCPWCSHCDFSSLMVWCFFYRFHHGL